MKSMASDRVTFDPATLNDPVAMQTDWTPAKQGGTSLGTHELVSVNSNRMEFRATIGAKLLYLVFLLAGVGILIGFSFWRLSSGGFSFGSIWHAMNTIVALLFGLIFAGTGGGWLYFNTAPIVFDKRKNLFWKGRKAPDEVFNKSSLKHSAELEQIHALQLISEYCPDSGHNGDHSYYSYELNLVLKNGHRINVVDHGNQNKLRDDACALSGFLEKPVWDAIRGKPRR